jgi:hypothetical protein
VGLVAGRGKGERAPVGSEPRTLSPSAGGGRRKRPLCGTRFEVRLGRRSQSPAVRGRRRFRRAPRKREREQRERERERESGRRRKDLAHVHI